MKPAVLAVVFLVVMGAALGCFWAAFLRRKTLRVHKRLGIAGASIDLLGTDRRAAGFIPAVWSGGREAGGVLGWSPRFGPGR